MLESATTKQIHEKWEKNPDQNDSEGNEVWITKKSLIKYFEKNV